MFVYGATRGRHHGRKATAERLAQHAYRAFRAKTYVTGRYIRARSNLPETRWPPRTVRRVRLLSTGARPAAALTSVSSIRPCHARRTTRSSQRRASIRRAFGCSAALRRILTTHMLIVIRLSVTSAVFCVGGRFKRCSVLSVRS